MKKILLSVVALSAMILGSCSYDRSPEGHYDPDDTGFEYVPEGDMYYFVSYQPMNEVEEDRNSYNQNRQSVRYPANGTVARGQLSYIYPYPNTPEGYAASAAFTNPYPEETPDLAAGKLAYETYCWQCHGKEGGVKGSLIEAGKFPNPTWDMARMDLMKTLPVGQMYHSISFGKGLMGPHNFILEPKERWAVINYLKQAANKAPAAEAKAEGASTETANTPANAGSQNDTATNAAGGTNQVNP